MRVREIIAESVDAKFWYDSETGTLETLTGHRHHWEDVEDYPDHYAAFNEDDLEYLGSEEYEQSWLQGIVFGNGWVRAGIDNGTAYFHGGSLDQIRKAAREVVPLDPTIRHVYIDTGERSVTLGPHEADVFIRSGRLPEPPGVP